MEEVHFFQWPLTRILQTEPCILKPVMARYVHGNGGRSPVKIIDLGTDAPKLLWSYGRGNSNDG